MARIRTIKPQHTQDRELPNISLQAHLVWILSWCFSDDDGVFDADPLLLKSNLFPRRTDVRLEQVAQWLDQLVKARYILPFDYQGQSYYIHRTFKAHQKIDRPNPSKIDSVTIRRILDDDSTNTRRPLVSVEESKGEERIVKERKRKAFAPPNFEEFEKYCQEKGFSGIARQSFDFYNEADWFDSKGNKVLNWKQKLISVWFKPENKTKEPEKRKLQM